MFHKTTVTGAFVAILLLTSSQTAKCQGILDVDILDKVKSKGDRVATNIKDPLKGIRDELAGNKKELAAIWKTIKDIDPETADLELWGQAGRHAYPTAAAMMISRSPKGIELSDDLKEVLRKYYGTTVDRVKIHWGVEPLDKWAAARFHIELESVDTTAQTFGYNIYIQQRQPDRISDEIIDTLAHELVHVDQYERFGSTLSNFGYHYFKEFKRGGQKYENNRLEIEADDRAGHIVVNVNTFPVNLQELQTTQESNIPLSGQRWFVQSVPNESFFILQNYRTGTLLDFDSKTEKANVQPRQESPEGIPLSGQRWYIKRVPNEDFFTIENYRAKGKVLDYDSDSFDVNLQDLTVKDGVPVSGQRWYIRSVPNEDFYYLENYRAKKVLDFRK